MPQQDKVASSGRVYRTPEDAPRAAIASGARTVTGNSSTFNSEDAFAIIGTLNITAASGTTPTLDAKLQESLDGGTTWNDIGAFPQKTGAGVHPKTFGPVSAGSLLRWSWTIAGTTPSFTFTIDTQARRAIA